MQHIHFVTHVSLPIWCSACKVAKASHACGGALLILYAGLDAGSDMYDMFDAHGREVSVTW